MEKNLNRHFSKEDREIVKHRKQVFYQKCNLKLKSTKVLVRPFVEFIFWLFKDGTFFSSEKQRIKNLPALEKKKNVYIVYWKLSL